MRFAQDGVSFRGKLIGVLEVSEPRGEKMCQEAMADLKMAIKAAGEHKRKIIIGIALDGLRLRDEGTRVRSHLSLLHFFCINFHSSMLSIFALFFRIACTTTQFTRSAS